MIQSSLTAYSHTMLSFRRLELSDLDALLELQETVRRGLPRPDLYQTEDARYLTRVIAGSGAAFAAFDGERMAAYGVVSFPGVHADNLCYDVPRLMIDPTEVAHLDGSGVHPEYRGLGIQQNLSVRRIGYAAEHGARQFLLTVSPHNPYSLRNHLNGGGFRVHAIKRKFGGVWRLILYRPLNCEEPTAFGHRSWCEIGDIEGHQRLLASGLTGARLVQRGAAWYLAYEAEQPADAQGHSTATVI